MITEINHIPKACCVTCVDVIQTDNDNVQISAENS